MKKEEEDDDDEDDDDDDDADDDEEEDDDDDDDDDDEDVFFVTSLCVCLYNEEIVQTGTELRMKLSGEQATALRYTRIHAEKHHISLADE